MDEKLKQNLTDSSTWKRGVYMLLFVALYSVAELVLFAIVIFQFAMRLFTGKVNRRLLILGQGLSTWFYEVFLFLTFKSERHPFPFDGWPEGPPGVAPGGMDKGAVELPKRIVSEPKRVDPDSQGETESGI